MLGQAEWVEPNALQESVRSLRHRSKVVLHVRSQVLLDERRFKLNELALSDPLIELISARQLVDDLVG